MKHFKVESSPQVWRQEEVLTIPRSNSPYDYHPHSQVWWPAEEISNIPRSNSPYDYHPITNIQQVRRQEEIAGIPRSNSPYDYHTHSQVWWPAEQASAIPRSNSPYDYHSKSSLPIINTPKAESTVNSKPQLQPAKAVQHLEEAAEHFHPSGCLGAEDLSTTKAHDMERMKHLWYCQQCLIMDEASGLKDAWGFSSAANSRSHSPGRHE